MIGNVYRGEGFRGLVDYLSHKPGSRLLDTNLDGSSPRAFARQIGEVRHLYPREHIAQPVCHIPFRPAPGEDLTDEQWNEVLHLALERMGFASSPYVAYLHDHGDGRHLHIATYRVTFEGKLVSDSNDRFRVMSVSREIEKAYSLSPGTAKNPVHFTRPALERLLRDPDRAKILSALRQAIDQAASKHDSVRSFLTELHRLGIAAEIKIARNTGALQGIRFALPDGNWIKGSDLGKDYSLAKICNRHELRIERRPEGRYIAMSEVSKKEYQTLCDDGLPPDHSVQYGSRRALFWELPHDQESAFVDLLAARLPHRFLHSVDELPSAQAPSCHLEDRGRATRLLQTLAKEEPPLALPLDQFAKGLFMEIRPAQLPDQASDPANREILDRLDDARRGLQRAGADYAAFHDAARRRNYLEGRAVVAGVIPFFEENFTPHVVFPEAPIGDRHKLLQDYNEACRDFEVKREGIPFLLQATNRYLRVEAEAVDAGIIPPSPPPPDPVRMPAGEGSIEDFLSELAQAGRELSRAGDNLPAFREAARWYNSLLDLAIEHEIILEQEIRPELEPDQKPGPEPSNDRNLLALLAEARRDMDRPDGDFPSRQEAARRHGLLKAQAIQEGLLRDPLQHDRKEVERAQFWSSPSPKPRLGNRHESPSREPSATQSGNSSPGRERPIVSATAKLTSMFEKQLLGQSKRAENLARRAARNAWARSPLGHAVLTALHPLRAIARSSPAAAVLTNTLGTVSETVRRSLAIYAELRAAHDRFRSTGLAKGHRTLAFGDFSNQSLAIPALGSRNPERFNQPIDLPEAIRGSRSAEAALMRSYRGFRRGVVSESQLAENAGRALAARSVVTAALHQALEIPSYRDFTAVLGSGEGRALTAWTGALQRAGLSARSVANSVAEIAPFALRSVATAVTLVGARRLVNWIAYHAKGVLLEDNARQR